ncbi:hypothetical protein AcV7_007543 [Taiwanofungus camphoratus]|nr:hypothetical protein AcV7_007543 [Antrodia cinnamomea]
MNYRARRAEIDLPIANIATRASASDGPAFSSAVKRDLSFNDASLTEESNSRREEDLHSINDEATHFPDTGK